jgi:hypothetical protein
MRSHAKTQTVMPSATAAIDSYQPEKGDGPRPSQLVKRRILTFRMRPNPASVDTSDDPP